VFAARVNHMEAFDGYTHGYMQKERGKDKQKVSGFKPNIYLRY
jgi:hypothetical protein